MMMTIMLIHIVFNLLPMGERSIVINVSVCMSVHTHLGNQLFELDQLFVHVAYGDVVILSLIIQARKKTFADIC